jgi:hypothetical protein
LLNVEKAVKIDRRRSRTEGEEEKGCLKEGK